MRNRLVDRLVDKAEVLERYGELYEIFDDSREIQKEIDKIYDKINDLPYVDVECKVEPYREAIPIEWIDGYIKRRAYDENIYAEILFISDMVKEWEKENETEESNRNI